MKWRAPQYSKKQRRTWNPVFSLLAIGKFSKNILATWLPGASNTEASLTGALQLSLVSPLVLRFRTLFSHETSKRTPANLLLSIGHNNQTTVFAQPEESREAKCNWHLLYIRKNLTNLFSKIAFSSHLTYVCVTSYISTTFYCLHNDFISYTPKRLRSYMTTLWPASPTHAALSVRSVTWAFTLPPKLECTPVSPKKLKNASSWVSSQA